MILYVEGGHDCLVVSPASIPRPANSRVKTNRLDSKKQAKLLSGRQLKGIRVPLEAIRHLRSLVHLRYTYMQDIRAYKCRIKAELLKEWIPFPKAPKGSQWSSSVIAALRNLDCSAVTDWKINAHTRPSRALVQTDASSGSVAQEPCEWQ